MTGRVGFMTRPRRSIGKGVSIDLWGFSESYGCHSVAVEEILVAQLQFSPSDPLLLQKLPQCAVRSVPPRVAYFWQSYWCNSVHAHLWVGWAMTESMGLCDLFTQTDRSFRWQKQAGPTKNYRSIFWAAATLPASRDPYVARRSCWLNVALMTGLSSHTHLSWSTVCMGSVYVCMYWLAPH